MFFHNCSSVQNQMAIVMLILGGMFGLALDTSFITFKQDLEKIWSIALDPYKFPPMTQLYIKYLLSIIKIVRTFTVHITLALYFVILWPAIFYERSNLLIPWLVVAFLRIFSNSLAFIAGMYICSQYGFFSHLWIEFLIVQIVDHCPFFYIWLSVYAFRRRLHLDEERQRRKIEESQYKIKNRRKSRQQLMWPSKYLKEVNDEERNVMSESTFERLNDKGSSKKQPHRSLDTLLTLIDKERENETLISVESNDNGATFYQSLLRTLGISKEDVDEAKKQRRRRRSSGFVATLYDLTVESLISAEKPRVSATMSANCLATLSRFAAGRKASPPPPELAEMSTRRDASLYEFWRGMRDAASSCSSIGRAEIKRLSAQKEKCFLRR